MCCWEPLIFLGPSLVIQIWYKPSSSFVRNDVEVLALSPETKDMFGTNLRVRRLSVKEKHRAGIVKIRIARGEWGVKREDTDIFESVSQDTCTGEAETRFVWSLCSIPFTGCLQNTCAVLGQVIATEQTESCVHCDSQLEVRFPFRGYLRLCKFKVGRVYTSYSVPESWEWIEIGLFAWECFRPMVVSSWWLSFLLSLVWSLNVFWQSRCYVPSNPLGLSKQW